MKKRETWVDVAKGLGIIAVVLGHAPNNGFLHHYLYWFHMPLFFALTGYLFKPLENTNNLVNWIRKRTVQLIVPYLSFGILIFIVRFSGQLFDGTFSIFVAAKEVLRILYGGTLLSGPYAVFWFITCLWFTQVCFALLVLRFKSFKLQIAILGIAYLVAHIQTEFIHFNKIPWNVDVMLIAIVFYAFGYYIKQYGSILTMDVSKKILIFLVCITLLTIDYFGFINYNLDLKAHVYNNFILDLIIPLTFTTAFFIISKILSNLTFVTELGKMSLTIMYLHFPINYLVTAVFGFDGFIPFVFIGLIIPVMIHLIVQRFRITNMLFQGAFKGTKSSPGKLTA
ncbi:acyltransferase family protein [Bacillaceae bacterium OS4b]|nr:acyltransferase family protein [Bacillaceae bacterium OS4b]